MANDAEAAISDPAMAAEPIMPMAEATEVRAEAAEAMAEIADPSPEAADLSAEAAEAHDNAVLDMIALEMAAPDPDDVADTSDDETYEVEAEMQAAALPPAEPIIGRGAAGAGDRAGATSGSQPLPQTFLCTRARTCSRAFHLAPEPSLGSSLIASGIVRAARHRGPIRWRRSGA